MMTVLDNALLDSVCAAAAASPRRRKNHNLHASDEAPVHRLLNAVQPDSYIAPHRHLDPAKDETFIVLRGLMGLLIFDEAGNIIEKIKVGADDTAGTAGTAANGALGVDIPAGTWHTSFALVQDTVIFEVKAGPYRPLSEAERAPWAPMENAPGAAAQLADWQKLFSV
jgi:cupin fold WbuC family metalloprotein